MGLILSALALSSCQLWREQDTRPCVKVPQQWSSTSHVQLNSTIKLPTFLWWQQFRNDELNQLVQVALARNNKIQVAMAHLEHARGELLRSKLEWVPQLNGLGGFTQMPYFGNPGAFYIFFPKYTLNLFRQYRRQKNAEALVRAHVFAKDTIRLAVIAQVTTAFFTLIAQQELLRIEQQLRQDVAKNLMLHQTLYRNDLIAQDDVDHLNSLLLQTDSRIQLTRHRITVSQNILHYLLNQNPENAGAQGHFDFHTAFAQLPTQQIIPGQAPVRILTYRPDIREQEALLKATNERVGMATSQLLPAVSVASYLGQGSTVPGSAITLGEGYLNQPLLDLPLLADIKMAKADYRAQCRIYIDTIRKALRDIENDLSAYHALSRQWSYYEDAYRYEGQQCQLTHIRYQNGIDSDVDQLNCRIKLAKFEYLVIEKKLAKVLAMIRLYQDLGAGYLEH